MSLRAPQDTEDIAGPSPPIPVNPPQWRALLAAVLAVYALLQCLYIFATPLQSLTLPDNLPQGHSQTLLVGIGPDEKEHFLYVLSLAEGRGLPRPDPARRTSPQQFVTYQAQHPPLFYAVAAGAYRLASGLSPRGIWFLLRALCALCGGIVIVLVAEAARLSFPHRPFMALAAAPAVAFLPMFGYMTANLSNEPLAMVFGASVWLQLVRLARGHQPLTIRSGLVLGLTLGLAALTRLTALLWLPALAIVLTFCVRHELQSREQRLRALWPVLACVLCFGLLLAPWLAYNVHVYGSPVIRTFNRPLIGDSSLLEFLFIPSLPKAMLLTALFYSATSWGPFWLTRFTLPGGLNAARPWEVVFLALDSAIFVSLFFSRRRAKREEADPDQPGRVLLWGAGSAVGFCILVCLQQEVYTDWQVIYYAGRYFIAAIPAGALLLLTACAAWVPRTGRGPKVAAAVLTLCLLASDLYTVHLVQQFYILHPGQPDMQRLNQQ